MTAALDGVCVCVWRGARSTDGTAFFPHRGVLPRARLRLFFDCRPRAAASCLWRSPLTRLPSLAYVPWVSPPASPPPGSCLPRSPPRLPAPPPTPSRELSPPPLSISAGDPCCLWSPIAPRAVAAPPNATLPADAASHPPNPVRCTLSAAELAAARAHPPSPALLPAAAHRMIAPWSVRLHGAAMAAAFLVLLPAGTAAAAPPRGDSGGGGSWFALHRGFQLSGVAAAAAGLAAILSHNSTFLPSRFWRDPHGYYGLAVLVGTAVQAAVGLVRPAAESPLRAAWAVAHRVAALSLAAAAIVALLTGLRSVAWVYGYPTAMVSGLVVAGGALGAASWVVARLGLAGGGGVRPSAPDDAAPYEAVETGGGLGDGWTERAGRGTADAKLEWGDLRSTLWWTLCVLRLSSGAATVGWVLLASGRV